MSSFLFVTDKIIKSVVFSNHLGEVDLHSVSTEHPQNWVISSGTGLLTLHVKCLLMVMHMHFWAEIQKSLDMKIATEYKQKKKIDLYPTVKATHQH